MGCGGRFALALMWLGGSLVFGQDVASPNQPGPEQSGPPTEQTRPPTPEEERARQVQQFDPLAKDNNQDALDKAAREAAQRRDREQRPLPGSIAETNRQNAHDKAGPRVDGDVSETDGTNEPEYTGPAVLSRSYTVNQPLVSPDIKWQEIFSMSTVFDTGAAGLIGPNGQTTYPLLTSTQTAFNLRARHAWRKEQLRVSFDGSNSTYFGAAGAAGGNSGGNYTLTVSYRQILTPHLSISVNGSGVLYSQNYALENPNGAQTDVANISISSSPNIQIFDAGSKQFNSSIDVTYQKSARLSFSGGIGYFGIEQNAPGYLGTTGQQVRGDMNYRLTKKTTVGTYYSWSYYLLPHGAGNTHSNTLGAIYSYAFSRSLQLRFRGGGSQVQSVGLQVILVNPALAFLLGESTGIVDSYSKFSTTDISGQLIKDFGSNRTASLSYVRGISPGNGVYQASQQESYGASFSTLIWRHYRVSATAGHDTLKSVAQTLGTYGSKSVGVSVGRSLGHGLSINVSTTWRRLDITNVDFTPLHDQYRISTGISYSPGEGRLIPRI